MVDEPLDQSTIEFIRADLQLRAADFGARQEELANQKEIALASIETQSKDREQSRETYERESVRKKVFLILCLIKVFLILCLIVVMGFMGYVIEQGYAENIFSLLGELFKYGLAFLGGSGLTVIYYSTLNNNSEN